MAEQIFKKLPGVLSFQRGMIITDAPFFNVSKEDNQLTPLVVTRHGIRGTQNINKSGAAESSTAANASREEVSNIQTTDTAKLAEGARALAVRFGLRFLDLDNVLFACAPSSNDGDALIRDYRDSLDQFIQRAKDSSALDSIAARYARNIANGRWLWRNRTVARSVTVTATPEDGEPVKFDALTIPVNHFDRITEFEQAIGRRITENLRGDSDRGIEIQAMVDFGVSGSTEVFPSQNYVENKPRGFARPLYCLGRPDPVVKTDALGFDSVRIMGQAALRDQKIGNALRTIDTWYPKYQEYGKPIPVEPNGASLEAQEFFRDRKISAFEFAKRLNTLDPTSDDGLFMLACLLRGGVFSEGQ